MVHVGDSTSFIGQSSNARTGISGESKGGGVRPPQLTAQNLLNFMQFLENLAKSYVGAPWRDGAPPMGNPGSAPEYVHNEVYI